MLMHVKLVQIKLGLVWLENVGEAVDPIRPEYRNMWYVYDTYLLPVFQEGPKEPKTAVFVGQCVICNNSPTIQGTWILFPETQVCFQEGKAPQADVMYLLKR
jgi:hypothetical protein